MAEAHGYIAEGYARQRVPQEQLTGAHRVFFIVVGALCGLPVYVLAGQVVNGMGLEHARVAFLVGGLLSGTLGALSAYSGARTRMNLAMLADVTFGRLGGRLVKTVIALSLIGWVGVILSVLGATAGAAIQSLYGTAVNPTWIATIAAVVVGAISLHGVRGLEQVGMVIAPLLLVLLGWTLFKGCATGAVHGAAATGMMGFGAAVSAVVGEYVVGIVIQPDYGRFVRKPYRALIASGVSLGVVFPAILTLSAIPTFRCGAPDLINVMVTIGIGLPAIALLVLGAWIDASACLYSGSLSLTNEVRRFSLPWVTVISAGVGCVLAILHAERTFMPFLTILGVTFPPVASVNILHTLVYLNRRDPDRELTEPPWVRPSALIAWIAGSVTGYLTSRGYGSLTGIASMDSIVVAALTWIIIEAAMLPLRRRAAAALR